MVRSIKMAIMAMPLLLLVLVGATGVYAQPLGIGSSKTQQPQQKVLSSDNGRFVFGQISGSSKDQFMLDTATGRLWQIGESGKLGTFLKSIPYRNAKGECTILPGETSDAGPKKSVPKKSVDK
ncbi:MAG: hypothetical protein MUO68_06135 [Desulfobacteraceae bacterium]|nr:hypothetical protein [Desulfobacteraceae bacterium]